MIQHTHTFPGPFFRNEIVNPFSQESGRGTELNQSLRRERPMHEFVVEFTYIAACLNAVDSNRTGAKNLGQADVKVRGGLAKCLSETELSETESQFEAQPKTQSLIYFYSMGLLRER